MFNGTPCVTALLNKDNIYVYSIHIFSLNNSSVTFNERAVGSNWEEMINYPILWKAKGY